MNERRKKNSGHPKPIDTLRRKTEGDMIFLKKKREIYSKIDLK